MPTPHRTGVRTLIVRKRSERPQRRPPWYGLSIRGKSHFLCSYRQIRLPTDAIARLPGPRWFICLGAHESGCLLSWGHLLVCEPFSQPPFSWRRWERMKWPNSAKSRFPAAILGSPGAHMPASGCETDILWWEDELARRFLLTNRYIK